MRVLFSPLNLPRAGALAALALIAVLWLIKQPAVQPAHAADRGVAGHITDAHGEPVADAELRLYANDETQPRVVAHSQIDGAYLLVLSDTTGVTDVRVEVARTHFETFKWSPDPARLKILLAPDSLLIYDIQLTRQIGLSFWIATLVFVGVLVIVATERLHNALAALLGIAVIFAISLVGGAITPNLFIYTFEQALRYVDFDVIFLLLGMMIVIGVIEETGIFQWLAYQAYRLASGRVWLLAVILMGITFVTASLLDNVITMLLITPITLQIALVLGINPLALLIPALLSSNVGGMATLVGTPVNILIGSYAGLGFNDFLSHITLGTVLAEIGLVGYCLLVFRKEHRPPKRKMSARLIKKLEENSRIDDKVKLRKSLIVFGGLLILFFFGELVHLPPSVAAIIGAVVILLWVHPDIEEMMGVVDWTTLIFFIALFMLIGAVQEVGLLAIIADWVAGIVGSNLLAAVLVTVALSVVLSGAVDNIPFAAAMLPVVGFLTRTIPGAEANQVLIWALVVGANLGGNATLVGSSANLVVKGIADRAGYSISFGKFMKVGLPATLITAVIGCLWLLVHFR